MKQLHESHRPRRRSSRLGACGEEWVAVMFLLVVVVGVLAERVAHLDGVIPVV